MLRLSNYASFSQKYQGISGPVTNAFDGTNLSFVPHCRVLVFFLLTEHHWKFRFKELIIRHSYTFLNELSFEGHGWRVDDDGTFDCEYTGGEIVPHELIDILCDVSYACEEAYDDNKGVLSSVPTHGFSSNFAY